MKCPGFERLIDYLDGRLTSAEATRVSEHLDSACNRCAANREWYERIHLIAASDDSIKPPPWVFNRAIRIFENRREKTGVIERIGRLAASLVFDSMAQPALAEVRSTEADTRQLLYRAGDYNVDLQITPSDQSRAHLTGQILREGEAAFESVAGISLELTRAGEAVLSTSANQMGEFAFSDIVQGEYDLMIETPEGSITVPELPVIHSQ